MNTSHSGDDIDDSDKNNSNLFIDVSPSILDQVNNNNNNNNNNNKELNINSINLRTSRSPKHQSYSSPKHQLLPPISPHTHEPTGVIYLLKYVCIYLFINININLYVNIYLYINMHLQIKIMIHITLIMTM
jgi:hypothetical protein